ncbi:MAG: hypothetical protein PHU68_05955 [Paludibacter sp.]|nr:hypothetical protein [Paludibacter sp.]
MKLSDESLVLLEEYASNFLTITEIAILLDVDSDLLRESISKRETKEFRSYNKGKLKRILELRSQEIELAKLGSTVAIELVSKYIDNQKSDE